MAVMGTDVAIRIDEVSKAYRVYRRMSDLLREGVLGGERHDLFWALRNISFTVREGERIGIVGSNGAGKSTLLKLITGNLTPTSGSIEVNGRISALLSLIPALRKNETGLENIKLNLIMSGASRKAVPALVDEIVDFTELSAFIYQPVRTYSSGMQARLAFAVATAVTPEILIVDEVLGTGDAYFQRKAETRMRELCNRGKALLFVSHATQAIRNLCNRVLWLENGEVRLDSSADFVLNQYEEEAKRQQDLRTRSGNAAERAGGAVTGGATLDLFAPERTHLRLVASDSERFHDTHYVCDLAVGVDDGARLPVPLEMQALDDDAPRASLALLGTEWGRLHHHRGRMCRELSAKVGRVAGGIVVLSGMAAPVDGELDVELQFDSDSERREEALVPQYFDARAREWRTMTAVDVRDAEAHWLRHTYRARVPRVAAAELVESREHYERESKPAAQIGGISVICGGEQVGALVEGTPFEVSVAVTVNAPVALLDVCLKITRADGVYVFWQSSGMDDGGYRDVTRGFSAVFRFDPNVLGPGRYQVSATLGNGWDLAGNYPHSRIYDRKINVMEFDVRRRNPELEFGVVHMIVPVERRDEGGAQDAGTAGMTS